jgi:hypothetical protein
MPTSPADSTQNINPAASPRNSQIRSDDPKPPESETPVDLTQIPIQGAPHLPPQSDPSRVKPHLRITTSTPLERITVTPIVPELSYVLRVKVVRMQIGGHSTRLCQYGSFIQGRVPALMTRLVHLAG